MQQANESLSEIELYLGFYIFLHHCPPIDIVTPKVAGLWGFEKSIEPENDTWNMSIIRLYIAHAFKPLVIVPVTLPSENTAR